MVMTVVLAVAVDMVMEEDMVTEAAEAVLVPDLH